MYSKTTRELDLGPLGCFRHWSEKVNFSAKTSELLVLEFAPPSSLASNLAAASSTQVVCKPTETVYLFAKRKPLRAPAIQTLARFLSLASLARASVRSLLMLMLLLLLLSLCPLFSAL